MMTEKPIPDPSMDEILASIRQIIAADAKEEDQYSLFPINDDNEILDLTDVLPDELDNPHAPAEAQLNDAGEWASPRYQENTFEEQEKYPQNTGPQTSPYASTAVHSNEDSLLSQSTLSEATQAFHLLNKTIQEQPPSSAPHFPGNLQDQTLENVVRELLKPLLKEWLDAHLPSLVRSIVHQQVDSIVRQKGSTSYEGAKTSAVRSAN